MTYGFSWRAVNATAWIRVNRVFHSFQDLAQAIHTWVEINLENDHPIEIKTHIDTD